MDVTVTVEFLFKTDSGYPRDAGVVKFIRDGKPPEFPSR